MRPRHRARAPRWYPDVAPCRMRDILPPIPPRPSVSRPLLALRHDVHCRWPRGCRRARSQRPARGPAGLRFCLSRSRRLRSALALQPACLSRGRAGASLAPLWLLVLVVLPWLPRSLPAAFLIWSGPAALLVWLAVALSIVIDSVERTCVGHIAPRERDCVAAATDRRAARVRSFTASARGRIRRRVPGGDEPHYLIITQSLLKDGDLKIENNHRDGDYHAYFDGDLSKPDYRRLGRNGADLFHSRARTATLICAGICPCRISRRGRVSRPRRCRPVARWRGTWRGWSPGALTRHGLAGPLSRCRRSAIFHSFTVYPDGVGGVIVLTGIWALLRAEEEARSGTERAWSWSAARRCAGRFCRGSTRALPSLPAALARSFSCGCRHEPECRRQGGRLSVDPGAQRDLLDRLLHRHLRHARSVGAVRATKRGQPAFIPGGLAGLLVRSALRSARLRAGARLSRSPDSARMIRQPSIATRSASSCCSCSFRT